jgi:hypothetical protein
LQWNGQIVVLASGKRLVERLQGFGQPGRELMTIVSELNSRTSSYEEGRAVPMFQCLDMTANCAVGEMAFGSGTAEVAMAGCCLKGFQAGKGW